MHVRRATESEVAYIVDLSRRVQEKLSASGSLQIIGPIARDVAAAHVRAGTAHVLVDGERLLGSVFVAPLSDEFRRWLGLEAEPGLVCWYLEKLMLEPEEQGRGLGYFFVDGIKAYLKAQPQPALLTLDCWVGNDNLRAFYMRAGFKLHGVVSVPSGDFEVAVFTWSTREE